MERNGQGIRRAMWACLGFAVAACAAGESGSVAVMGAPPYYPPPGYSHTVESSQVALYWNCGRPSPGVVQVSGLAFNPWASQPVRYLEFELVGVDGGERTVSAARVEASDTQLLTHQSTPFQLTLHTTGAETRLDLYYRYQFQERGGNRMLASLAWDGPVLLAQQMQFRVWDACSDTLHRTP